MVSCAHAFVSSRLDDCIGSIFNFIPPNYSETLSQTSFYVKLMLHITQSYIPYSHSQLNSKLALKFLFSPTATIWSNWLWCQPLNKRSSPQIHNLLNIPNSRLETKREIGPFNQWNLKSAHHWDFFSDYFEILIQLKVILFCQAMIV